MPGLIGRRRSTTCVSPTRPAKSCWRRRSCTTRLGCLALCRTLVKMKVGLVAIERPDGVLVERLLDAGLKVLALHPNKVAAARDRFRVYGGKSDRFDAFVLCELARTDNHLFRVLEPDLDQTKALRAMTRAREDLVPHPHRRGQPAPLRAGPLLGPDHCDCSVIWTARSCSRSWSATRAQLTRTDSGSFGCRLFSSASATQAARSPRPCWRSFAAPQKDGSGSSSSPLVDSSCSLTSRWSEPWTGQIKGLERDIKTAVRAHPDGPVFLSLFKQAQSFITAAELLAEIGHCRARYPSRDALAADAGQSAVAKESGKRKTAQFRWGCNKRLRVAFSRLADSTRHWHPWAHAVYAQARQRGLEHPRAIRTLGRAWCRIVWQCWQSRTAYDPTRHRSLQQHATVTIPSPSGPITDLAATARMAADLTP